MLPCELFSLKKPNFEEEKLGSDTRFWQILGTLSETVCDIPPANYLLQRLFSSEISFPLSYENFKLNIAMKLRKLVNTLSSISPADSSFPF